MKRLVSSCQFGETERKSRFIETRKTWFVDILLKCNDGESVVDSTPDESINKLYNLLEKHRREATDLRMKSFDHLYRMIDFGTRSKDEGFEKSMMKFRGLGIGYFSNGVMRFFETLVRFDPFPEPNYIPIFEALVSVQPDLVHFASPELRDNRAFITKAIGYDGRSFEYASPRLRTDKELTILAFQNSKPEESYLNYHLIPDELRSDTDIIKEIHRSGSGIGAGILYDVRDDKDIVMHAIKCWMPYFFDASERLKKDQEVVVLAALNNPSPNEARDIMGLMSEELKADKETVMKIVACNGRALEFVSAELRNDRDVVETAIGNTWKSFVFASEELRDDFDLVMLALEGDASNFRYVSRRLKRDREVVMKAVGKSGRLLDYASAGMRDDPTIVMEAVREDGRALEFASDRLKNNREVVMSAVFTIIGPENKHWYINGFGYCGERLFNFKNAFCDLRSDREFVSQLVEKIPRIIEFASEELKNDRHLVSKALAIDGTLISRVSPELRRDREMIILSLETMNRMTRHYRDGYTTLGMCSSSITWECVFSPGGPSPELADDIEVVKLTVRLRGYYLQYASSELKACKEVVMAAVQNQPLPFKYGSEKSIALEYASEELRGDQEVVLAAVSRNGAAFKFASPELRKDREVVLAAVSRNGNALEFASSELRRDREVVLAAVSQCGDALEFASPELRRDREVVLAAISNRMESVLFVLS